MNDRRVIWGWALLLGACGDALELSSTPEGVIARAPVEVRLRPVCGDGEVQAGEACDDGNTEDGDGCNRRCQAPCPEGSLELIRCVSGRVFDQAYTVTSESGRTYDVLKRLETLRCARPSGAAIEIVVCQQTRAPFEGERACVNLRLPPSGGHLCAPECGEGCGVGEGCLEAVFADSDPPSFSADRCLPVIGGQLGDACASGADCAPSLNCNLVSGYESGGPAVCMPGDCDLCPAWSSCSPAVDTITGDPNGESCFARIDLGVGVRTTSTLGCATQTVASTAATTEGCAAGCRKIYGCNYEYAGASSVSGCQRVCEEAVIGGLFDCIAGRSGCDIGGHEAACIDAFNVALARQPYYCSQPCTGATSCPSGLTCAADYLNSGEGLCVLDDPSQTRAPPSTLSVLERDPARCPEDIDLTCAFGSGCDPDCARPLGCGDVPDLGLCQGQRLLYCDDSRVISVDCAARELRCAFDDEQRRFDCLRGGR